jgi:hypothetical protein
MMTWYNAKYKGVKPAFRGGDTNYNTINATKKYVEYFLDIQDMNDLLRITKSFDIKMDLLYCLDKAESKRAWNFRHPNFCQKDANTLLQAVRNAKRKDGYDITERFEYYA